MSTIRMRPNFSKDSMGYVTTGSSINTEHVKTITNQPSEVSLQRTMGQLRFQQNSTHTTRLPNSNTQISTRKRNMGTPWSEMKFHWTSKASLSKL